MAVNPRGADLKRMLQAAPDDPVVMLNLLRFVPGGRAQYVEYLHRLREDFLPAFGGEILYLGDGAEGLVGESGQLWDMVLLVRYQTRRHFSRMVADPEYQEAALLRTASVSEAVLQATTAF
jgi:uncharacterized protein (DUF1330 family)